MMQCRAALHNSNNPPTCMRFLHAFFHESIHAWGIASNGQHVAPPSIDWCATYTSTHPPIPPSSHPSEEALQCDVSTANETCTEVSCCSERRPGMKDVEGCRVHTKGGSWRCYRKITPSFEWFAKFAILLLSTTDLLDTTLRRSIDIHGYCYYGDQEGGKDGKAAVRTSSLWFVCDFESYLAHITVTLHVCIYYL